MGRGEGVSVSLEILFCFVEAASVLAVAQGVNKSSSDYIHTSSTRPGRPGPPPAELVKTGSRLNIWCRFCVRKKYKQVWWALKIGNEFFVKCVKLKKLLRAQYLLQSICFWDLKQLSDLWLYKEAVWGDFFKAGIQVTELNKEKFRLLNIVPALLSCSKYLQQVLWSRKWRECAMQFFFSLFAMQQGNRYKSLQ